LRRYRIMKVNRWVLTVSRLFECREQIHPVFQLLQGANALEVFKAMANAPGRVNEFHAVRRQSRG
jgi:hypothetical protein